MIARFLDFIGAARRENARINEDAVTIEALCDKLAISNAANDSLRRVHKQLVEELDSLWARHNALLTSPTYLAGLKRKAADKRRRRGK